MSRPGGFYEPLNEAHRQVQDDLDREHAAQQPLERAGLRWLAAIEAREGDKPERQEPEHAAPDRAEPINAPAMEQADLEPDRPEGHPAERFTWSGHGDMLSEERAAFEWLAAIEARTGRTEEENQQQATPDREAPRVAPEPENTRDANREGAPRELSDRERDFYDRFPELTRSEHQDEPQRDQGNERTMGQE